MSETLNSPFQDHWYIWLSANASIALERTLQFSWLSTVLDLVMKLNKWSQFLNFCGALCLLRHTQVLLLAPVSSSCERVHSPKNSHWYQVQEAASWQVFSVYRHSHVRPIGISDMLTHRPAKPCYLPDEEVAGPFKRCTLHAISCHWVGNNWCVCEQVLPASTS